MVIPKLAWKGAWATLTRETIARVTTACELAALGRARPWAGRSRALVCTAVLGPSIHPGFSMDMALLRRFRSAAARGQAQQLATGMRARALAQEWGWHLSPDGGIRTPQGSTNLAWEGLPAIRALE